MQPVWPHKSCPVPYVLLAVMPDILKPDLCIVGAGALGISLAIKARQRGLATVLIDRGAEPGDAVGGPIRRAAFVASAMHAHAIRTGARLGLENSMPKINFRAVADHARGVAAATASGTSAERLSALGIAVLTGEPGFIDGLTLRVGDSLLKAGHFLLATGAAPLVPDIPQIENISFFTPDTIPDNTRKLSHLLVVGGAATGLELAQAYRRLGSDVTLVPHGPLLDGYDREATAILLRQLREEGLVVLDGARVSSFQPRSQGIGIALEQADGQTGSLDVSHVLVAAGRVPDLDWTASDKVRLRRRPASAAHLQLNAWGRTSSARISAFGGAAGEGNHHRALLAGERLLDSLAGRRPSRAYGRNGLPTLVHTQPALAQTGATDTPGGLKPGQAVLRANMNENDAARALGLGLGSAKLVVDRGGRILGGAMVGEGAGEAMASLAMAMGRGVRAAELARLPLAGTSALAVLQELGNQLANQLPASNWSKRRAALRRLLP